jgi:CubicO group peptidase (beta-lactamase class C family)
MRALIALCLALFAFPLSAASIGKADLGKLLDSVIPREMEKRGIPGAAFVLVQNGKVVLIKGYGFADVATKKRVDPEKTIFPIASISKVFTATAVVQLADRGKLDLHADVNRYLKRIQSPPVTAAQLLTHQGGFDELRGRLIQEGEQQQSLHTFLATRLVRVHAAGEQTSYSSFGAALAGLLIEEVAGLTFEQYLDRNVFKPLRMQRSGVGVPKSGGATGYEAGEKGIITAVPWERYHTPPASAVYSTAADMSRFMMAMLAEGKGILSAPAARSMLTQQATMHPRLPGYGYGWQMSDTNGQRIAEHGGDIGGFSSLMTLLPEHDLGFFLVNHREGIDLREPVKRAILDRYFPAKPSLGVAAAGPEAGSIHHSRQLAGTYRGSFWCHTCPFDADRVNDVEVVANDDGSLTIWKEKWVEVEPYFFRGADGKGRVGFHVDAKGEVTAMTGGAWLVWERLRTMPR